MQYERISNLNENILSYCVRDEKIDNNEVLVVTENKIDSYIAMCGEALYISFSNNKNQVYK